MNKGKIFEQDFKKSLPELNDLFFYRFKDGTANWSGEKNQNVRFQQHNIADCMIFYKGKLFILELKAHLGKSLPLYCIRDTQFFEMCEASQKDGVIPMIVTFFYEIGECYAIPIDSIKQFRLDNDRKSIPLSYIQENGFKIDCELKKTHYKFDIVNFLNKIAE